MGKFDFEISTDIARQLNDLANVDAYAPKIIDAAVPHMVKSLKEGIEAAGKKGYSTGALMQSIKGSNAKKNKYGHYSIVRPTGTDSKKKTHYYHSKKGNKIHARTEPTRNMEKLVYMEYGTGKQAATPVMVRAKNNAEDAVLNTMQEELNKVVGK